MPSLSGMNKIDDTIAGVLVWAAVLEWAERSHQGEWEQLVRRAQDEISNPVVYLKGSLAMMAAQTYLIGMALDHMAERLRWLEGQKAIPARAQSAVTEFLTLHVSQELEDLRDVLAHAHDYAVGKGIKPHLIANPDLDVSAPGVSITAGRVSAIGMFGRRYQVREIIEAANRVAGLFLSSWGTT